VYAGSNTGSVSFNNSGDISVLAEAGSAIGNYSGVDSDAYGVYLWSDSGNVTIENTGSITATAKAGDD